MADFRRWISLCGVVAVAILLLLWTPLVPAQEQSNVLFPVITNQAGFDTGLVIAADVNTATLPCDGDLNGTGAPVTTEYAAAPRPTPGYQRRAVPVKLARE